MASLDQTIKNLQEKQFQSFASDQEKRTRELMKAVESYTSKMSGESAAYMDALKDVIEKSGNKSSHQLGESVKQIKDLQQILKAQTDIAEQDRQVIETAMKATQRSLEDKTTSKFLGDIKDRLDENAIDITSVVAGVTGNSPMMMMATKYVLDKRKQAKEEKKARAKAEGEEALERLTSLGTALQAKKNVEKESKILDAKASASMGGGDIAQVGLEDLTVWNEIQAEELEKIRVILDKTYVGNQDWRDDQETASRNDEENRRESNRKQDELIAAIEGIEGGAGVELPEMEGGGGLLGGLTDWLKSGFAGAMGGLSFGALGSAISGALAAAGPALAIGTGLAMAAKDGWDIASAAFDDDITTSIQGEDIGGVAGSAIGGAIGFVLGGPVGAGIGMAIGNMAGDFVGGWLAPNMDEVFAETQTKINETRTGLRASMDSLNMLLQSGQISQEDYDAQAAVINSQLELNEQYAAEAREVEAKNQARMAIGQRYNELANTIKTMEDQGLEVSQSMYDALDNLETEYNTANEAYETAAAELQSKVDPSWYDELSTTMMNTWESLQGAASSAWGTMTGAFESAKGWFAQKIADLDEAFGVSEAVSNAVDYVEQKAEELATRVSETVAETAQAVDEAVTDTLATVGLDDEYQAVKDGVADAATAVAEGVTATVEAVQETVDEALEGTDFSDGVQVEDLQAIGENVAEMAGEAVDAAQEAVGEAVEAAGEKVQEGLEYLGIDDEVQAVQEGLQNARDKVGGWLSALNPFADDEEAINMPGYEQRAGRLDAQANQVADLLEQGDQALADGNTALAEAMYTQADNLMENVSQGWERLEEENELWIEEQKLQEEQDKALEELTETLEDTAKEVEEVSLGDRISSWWGGLFGSDPVPTAQSGVVNNVAQNLRPGNAYTPLEVDTGTNATRRDALIRQMDAAGITDPNERASIMAQAHHETGGFGVTEENFNYSGRRLFELYGAGNSYGNRVRFNSVEEANALVAQGQSAVGDVIYGGRMGNTDVGDGFKYRGRGAFQLTGRDNYRRYGEMIGVDLESNPELANDPEIGAKLAVAYYQDRVSGRGIDPNDVDAVSRAINGGTVGLQDRRDLFASYQREGVPSLSGSGALTTAQGELNDTQLASSDTPAPVTVVAGGGGGAPVVAGGDGTQQGTGAGSAPVGHLTPEEIMIMYGGGQGMQLG